MADFVAKPESLPARIGRHDVVGYIATGGMAELFLGVDPTTQRPVVIKRILPHLARQPAFVSMFIDEARIGSLIHHPNLVEIFELGQVGNDLFQVMEYLEGENLAGIVRRAVARKEPFAYMLAAHVIAQACGGLHAAHELRDEVTLKPLRIVHRDVSPQNLFVTYDGDVKVLDFGIATAAHRLTKTSTGTLKGKFSYMSPEQCRGEPLDARSDIFSLGVVLYELSMQKRLFKRANELMVLSAVCEEPIPRPSRERQGYPRALEEIVLRALSRDLDRRYASAAEMQRDLIEVIKSLSREAPEPILATTMHRLFPDRIAEKHELLAHLRDGTALGDLPAAEVDESVDVPLVSQGSSATPSFARVEPVRRGLSRGARIGLSAAFAFAAGGAVYWYVQRDHGAVPVAAAEPPRLLAATPALAPAPPAPAPAAPAVTTVAIDIDSIPSGAVVMLDDVRAGTTPFTTSLARGGSSELRLVLDGYEPLVQPVAFDRDERLVLALKKKLSPNPTPGPARPPHARPTKQPDPPKPPPAVEGDGFHRFD